MFITPNSDIFVLHGVPLDPSYDHTIYFERASDQYNYFSTRSKYRFTNQYYQRHGRNYIRVQQLADNMFDCNYLMFRNTTFGTRWFYAFILSVNYINNNVSEIEYQIDVMQTWAFDYVLNPSWVIREHSATDVPGDNTEPEIQELGPMLYEDLGDAIYTYNTNAAQLCAVVACTFDDNFDNEYSGGMVSGSYSGLFYKYIPLSDGGTALKQWLSQAIGNNLREGIIKIFLVPAYTLPPQNDQSSIMHIPKLYTRNISWTTQDGYPKNKKLYTYPYNFLYISNNNGDGATYAWERFAITQGTPNSVTFDIKLILGAVPEASITPRNYDGVNGLNHNERLLLQNFPECSWSSDFFQAWLAGYGRIELASDFQPILSTAGETAMSFTGLAPRNQRTREHEDKSAIIQAGNAIYDTLEIANKMYVYSTMPRQLAGKNTNGLNIDWNSTNNTTGSDTLVGFRGYNVRVRDEYLRRIDDYFSRFGYATNRLKVPNRDVRTNWTYTRTAGCTITIDPNATNGLPADDEAAICDIYNKGITFWRDPANVGDYTLPNGIRNQN